MGRGFECGNGWMPLIDALCYQIQTHIDWHNKFDKYHKQKNIPQFVATQVKEKFGLLRIYHEGGDEYCKGLISMAGCWSGYICEMCGIGSNLLVGRTSGYLGSLCKECSKKTKRPIHFDKEIKTMLTQAIRQDSKKYVQRRDKFIVHCSV
jgi:hypothetical protein